MALTCKDITKSDPTAALLCESLSEELSVPPSAFDRGTCRIDYSSTVGKLPICTGPDSTLDPLEIYQEFLRIAPSPSEAQKSTAVFAKKFGRIPWQFDAEHKGTADTIVANVRGKTSGATEDATYAVADALLQAIRAPRKKGGLGIKFRSHGKKEADVNNAIERGFVHCSEFQTLFYALGKMLGLKMYPVEVPQIGSKGEDIPHTAIVIADEVTGNRYFADLELDHIQRESPYKEYYVGTETDMLAIFLYNNAIVKEGGKMQLSAAKDTPLLLAEEIAPDNDLVMAGLGAYYWRLGDDDKAGKYFRKAFELRPTNLTAIKGYCLATFDIATCAKRNRRYFDTTVKITTRLRHL